MNPYWGQDFWGFFATLFRRLTGALPLEQLPSDELQLLVLIAVAASTVVLGTFLSLKKITMMANALSHTTLLGIVLAYFMLGPAAALTELGMASLFLAALISALLTAFLTEVARDLLKLPEDAAIGLVFTTLFALSIVLVTVLTRNTHLGVEAITGNVDALHPEDLKLALCIAGLNAFFIVLFFRQWTMTAFDEKLAYSLGVPTRFFHYLLMLLTALTLVTAFRSVGVVLVLSFIVGPTLTARLWTNRLVPLLLAGLAYGVGMSIVGVALSRHFLSVYHIPLSTGGLIVTLIALGYALSLLGVSVRRRKDSPQRHRGG
jgi:manganese/zinc/iron transport system permease protein